jgi:hypothetical protein
MKSIQTRGGHTSGDAMYIPFLRALVMSGGDAHKSKVYEKVRDLLYLTESDLVPDERGQPYYYRDLNQVVGRLRRAGLVHPVVKRDGYLRITPAGRILAGYTS